MKARRGERGATTVVLVVLAAGFGVAGLAAVGWISDRIGEQALLPEPEPAELAYTSPANCAGARVVSRFPSSADEDETGTRESSDGTEFSVTARPLNRALHEAVLRADLNEDGVISAAFTQAGITGIRPGDGWAPGGENLWVMVYTNSPNLGGFVAVHQGRGCWTSGICDTSDTDVSDAIAGFCESLSAVAVDG